MYSVWSGLFCGVCIEICSAGVSHLSYVMAHEHRAMSISLPFVLHGLGPTVEAKVPARAAWCYLEWRALLAQQSFCDDDLSMLQRASVEAQQSLNQLSLLVSNKSIGNVIKFHMMTHWEEAIKRFGMPSNFDTETWESAHKVFVKPWVGKLGHHPEMTLMKRDLPPQSAGDALVTTKTNCMFRGHIRSSFFATLSSQFQALFCKLDNVLNTTEFFEYRGLWSEPSDCWIRVNDCVMYKWGESRYELGLVQTFMAVRTHNVQRFVLLQPLQHTPITSLSGSHFLYDLVRQQKLSRVGGTSKLRAVVVHAEQQFIAVHLQPDFAQPEKYFVNTRLL